MGGGKRAMFFAGIVLGLSGFAGGAVKELPLPDVPAEMKRPESGRHTLCGISGTGWTGATQR